MSIFDDIWSGIKTGFNVIIGDEDTLYPDNPQRKARTIELFHDVENYQSLLVANHRDIHRKLDDVGVDFESTLTLYNFDFVSWQISSPYELSKVLNLSNVQDALMISGLLALGDKSKQERLIDSIELPFDIKLITIKGVPILPVSGGVVGGSITGAIARDKFREYIKNIVPIRTTILYHNMLLEELSENLSRLGSRETLVSLYGEDAIEKHFKTQVDAMNNSISKITKESAWLSLEQIDKDRNSWTDEDLLE